MHWKILPIISFLLLVFFASPLFFQQKAAADWTNDVDVPEVTIQVTCGGTPLANGGTCQQSPAVVKITCKDKISGCQTVNFTFPTSTTTYSVFFNEDDTTPDANGYLEHTANLTAPPSSFPSGTTAYNDAYGTGFQFEVTNSVATPTVTVTDAVDYAGNHNTTTTPFSFEFRYTVTGIVYLDRDHNCSTATRYTDTLNPYSISASSGTVTNDVPNGGYRIDNISNGSYTVTITAPSGWTISDNPCTGTASYDPVPQSSLIVNLSSPPNQTLNFYLTPMYDIDVRVYEDRNQNLAEGDAGEAGKQNITVELLNGPTTKPNQTTNSTGNTTFSNLLTGTYTVRITTPRGYKALNGLCNPNSCNGPGTSETTLSVTVADASTIFYITPLYEIKGNVYLDDDKSFLKDNGETNYLGAITVTLTNASGATVAQYNCSSSCDGTFTFSNVLSVPSAATSQYTLSYGPPPGGYEYTYPRGGTAAYTISQLGITTCAASPTTTPGGVALPLSCYNAYNSAEPLYPASYVGSLENANFGITNAIQWYQGKGGDMRNGNQFVSKVPLALDTKASCDQATAGCYNAGSPNTPGIFFSGTADPRFSPSVTNPQYAKSSKNQWIVGTNSYPAPFTTSGGGLQTSYNVLNGKLQGSGITPQTLPNACLQTSGCSLTSLSSGIYKHTGNVYITASAIGSNKKVIILSQGDISILGAITVSVGSAFTVVADGDIRVDKSIGNTDYASLTSNLEGFYVADGSFIPEGTNNNPGVACISQPDPNADRRLNIAGAVVANADLTGGDSIQITNRDLCKNDLSYPVLYITERPDFLLNMPEFLKMQNSIYQEIAP